MAARHTPNKYEKVEILYFRCRQLLEGARPLISNPEKYTSLYEIALEEFKQGLLGFIGVRKKGTDNKWWRASISPCLPLSS